MDNDLSLLGKHTESLYLDLADQPGLPIGIKFCDNCEYETKKGFLPVLF